MNWLGQVAGRPVYQCGHPIGPPFVESSTMKFISKTCFLINVCNLCLFFLFFSLTFVFSALASVHHRSHRRTNHLSHQPQQEAQGTLSLRRHVVLHASEVPNKIKLSVSKKNVKQLNLNPKPISSVSQSPRTERGLKAQKTIYYYSNT